MGACVLVPQRPHLQGRSPLRTATPHRGTGLRVQWLAAMRQLPESPTPGVGTKESGAIPELPRSGIENEPHLEALAKSREAVGSRSPPVGAL
jgi:hypothetical protein